MAARKLTESLEDYLEVIYHVVGEKQAARAKDIVARLEVSGASVTEALRALAERGMINYTPYDLITLTTKGTHVAEGIVRKHEVIRDFLVRVLGAEPSAADEMACKMEHSLTQDMLDRLLDFIRFVQLCPRGGTEWLEKLGQDCAGLGSPEECEACLRGAVDDFLWKRDETTGAPDGVMRLDEIKAGGRGKVVDVGGDESARERLMALGVAPGCLVEVEAVGNADEPLKIVVNGYHRSLTGIEAACVAVETL